MADDEFLIAITIEETLREAGADVINAGTLAAALNSATEDPLSAAILDVRMGRQTTEAVATALAARGVPFFFYSGQMLPPTMRDKHPATRVVMKPASQSTFVDQIFRMVRS